MDMVDKLNTRTGLHDGKGRLWKFGRMRIRWVPVGKVWISWSKMSRRM